uniref:Uncharacterized protein n=1 Tax=Globodera rostochiensis TaxID=31243 RepID=A0A914GWD8_GLORO
MCGRIDGIPFGAMQGELNGLDMQLVEFDVALKFNEAKDLAKSAQKIFNADKSNERVRLRIGQLFSVLLNAADKKFTKELVGELSMDALQEMFFFAFPDQRNSTKGSLQVYLTWATNQPQSLRKIATKLFAYYLEEEVTPVDGVLFLLFDSLIQTDFGDLSLHNIVQLFHILLRNCFADTTCQLSDDFYSPFGLSLPSSVPRPSVCWHFCLQLLSLLFARRGQPSLAQAIRPLNDSLPSSISTGLDNAMGNAEMCAELFKSAEFVRLVICWTFASSSIRKTQIAVDDQFVSLPANVFSVTPSALEHFWLYTLESEDDDSPAEIEEPQQKKALRVNPKFLEPIRQLNLLFSSSPIAEQQFAALCPSLNVPNARSVVVLALTVSENWKRASELLEHFKSNAVEMSATERSLLRVQQLQTFIRLRNLPKAFELCIELLGQFVDFSHAENSNALPPKFPLAVARDHRWVLLSHHAHLRLFLLLLLFHICWLAFAKCVARGVKANGDENADLCFLSLIVLAQSCWADFGFGLFEQLCEHVAAADRFRCCDLFQYVSNAVLVDELLCLDHVPMALCPEGTFLPTVEWRKAVLEGKVRLAARPALALLGQFLADNRQKMIDLFTIGS